MTRRLRPALALGLAFCLITACGGDASLPSEVTGSVPEQSAPATTAAPQCSPSEGAKDATPSYAAMDPLPVPGDFDPASTMAAIVERGRLIVGVSGDTLLFGTRNPLNGRLEGFDIDMVKQVAVALFGEGGDENIEYKVITYAQRLPSLEADDVDIVAHTMTINCNRWLRIAFSSEYFSAGQKLLVKTGSPITGKDTLIGSGARVCAPEGSTNIDEISKPEYTGIEVVGTPDISDCLVAMQQGEVDVVTGDDTVLAGFAAQDPSTQVVGDAFTEEPYGLGINRGEVDFVQFVNGVLAEIRTDGRWAEIYQRWLIDTGALADTTIPDPPVANESRPLP